MGTPGARRGGSHSLGRAGRGGPKGPCRAPAAPVRGHRMSAVRSRNESAWLLEPDGHIDRTLRDRMCHYDEREDVDLVVVGAGAGGSVLTQRLARRGWRVVTLDAGPWWDPDRDWVSDERGSHELYWNEPRVIGGDDPIPMGAN